MLKEYGITDEYITLFQAEFNGRVWARYLDFPIYPKVTGWGDWFPRHRHPHFMLSTISLLMTWQQKDPRYQQPWYWCNSHGILDSSPVGLIWIMAWNYNYMNRIKVNESQELTDWLTDWLVYTKYSWYIYCKNCGLYEKSDLILPRIMYFVRS